MLTRRDIIIAGLGVLAVPSAQARTANTVILPGDVFPIDLSHKDQLKEVHRKQLVDYDRPEHVGAIVVDPNNYFLYQVRDDGTAIRYGVGVGRAGFAWKGEAKIMNKRSWPDWYPPAEMRERQPYLPEMMPGGPKNPLGARALYLYEGKVDTLYRIHGTAEPESIGHSVSSGCIRMINEYAVDLYGRVPIGTRVIVL